MDKRKRIHISDRCDIIDLRGQKKGYWEVLHKAIESSAKYKVTYWTCRCVCGFIRDVNSKDLRNGSSKSCGCSKAIVLDGRIKKDATVSDIAWAAGFFDGEGSVSLRRSGYEGRFDLAISIAQKIRLPLDKFNDIWKGYIRFYDHQRPMFQYTNRAEVAAICLQSMLPYLTVKKPHAELAAEFMKFRRKLHPIKNQVTAEVLAKFEEFKARITVLNKRRTDYTSSQQNKQ